MKLNARQVETAKPKDKPYKMADGGGMYLEVFPNGTKSWRMKYRIAGKEKRVVFGVYLKRSTKMSSRLLVNVLLQTLSR